MKNVFAFALVLFLVACGGNPTPSVVHPTFTARVAIGNLSNTDVGEIYASYTFQNLMEKVPLVIHDPACFRTEEKDDCLPAGVDQALKDGVVITMRSGCWTATKKGDAYTDIKEC